MGSAMAGGSEIATASTRIETALARAARSRVIPDYAGFQAFIAPHLTAERDAQVSAVHPKPGPYTQASMMLLTRYHERISKMRPSPMDFRRYKLLRSLYADNGRGEQMVRALLHGTLPTDPTLDVEQVTPAVLRMRLIAAIEKQAYEDAHFLLGRLDEADHDHGERAYLQALASFASGRHERTIRLVATISKDAIDRTRAVWLAAKAAALLGDATALEPLLTEVADRLTPCGWLHLIELLDPALHERQLPFFTARLPSTLVVAPSDPAYDEWAMLHARMMGRVLARDREIIEASAAAGSIPAEEAIAADPVFRRNAAAWRVEHLLGRTGQAREVAMSLHPVIAKGDMRAFRAAVEMLSDADDSRAVVGLARRFPHCARLPWHLDFDIVGVVYGYAIVIDQQWARRLRRLLGPDRLGSANRAARRMIVADRLTPMGRISFLAAAAELDRIREAENTWRDCGLIALGLFRALEVEFNARLARPLAARLNIAALRSTLPEHERGLRSQLKVLDGASTAGHGLMLGDLARLLVAMSAVTTEDPQTSNIRVQLRAGLEALLISEAPKAVAADRLHAMIGPSVTGRFRNPPAHGDFLRFEDAGAALVHVEDALDTLTAWLPLIR